MESVARLSLAILGCAAGLALVGAGLAYVFSPLLVQALLKRGLAIASGVLAVFIVLQELERAGGPLIFVLLAPTLSALAYGIREHRLKTPVRSVPLRGIERTPVTPGGVPPNRP